jgi:hypothetical protein
MIDLRNRTVTPPSVEAGVSHGDTQNPDEVFTGSSPFVPEFSGSEKSLLQEIAM